MLDTQNRFFTTEVNLLSENITRLLQAADEIVQISKDLQAKGKLQDALKFALLAAQYVNVARSLEKVTVVPLQ